MICGGLQTCSLIDFPGRVSCVLFFAGCNFACPYCHNPDLALGLVPEGGGMDGEAVLSFLQRRRGLLDGVVLCGGEPTVQPDLEDLCRRIKSMGYAVKLDTNGGRPGVVARLIEEKAVDYIAVDVKTDPGLYAGLLGTGTGGRAVAETIPLVMNSGVEYEFRTTCVSPFVDEDIVKRVAALLAGADLYVLQRGRAGKSLVPDFFTGGARLIDDAGLREFKAIAEKKVKRCVIR